MQDELPLWALKLWGLQNISYILLSLKKYQMCINALVVECDVCVRVRCVGSLVRFPI
jgi:hypothetical protein